MTPAQIIAVAVVASVALCIILHAVAPNAV
jgi:hypothetical protein